MTNSSTVTDPFFELMATHLAAAVIELFASYDLPVRRSLASSAVADRNELSGISTIGYVGERVRGALVLIASETATRAWLTAIDPERGESAGALPARLQMGDLADTIGEFSNMVLGR